MPSFKKKRAIDQLNPREATFVAEYVIDSNGTRAAKEAGYKSPHAIASNMLKKPKIKAAIAELMKPVMTKARLTQESLTEQLANYVWRTIKDFVGSDGYLITNPKDLPDAVAQCVESWEAEILTEWDEEAHAQVPVGQKIKVKLVSKSKMQEVAMKFMGMLQPDTQTTLNVGFNWQEFYARQEPPAVDAVEARIKGVQDAQTQK